MAVNGYDDAVERDVDAFDDTDGTESRRRRLLTLLDADGGPTDAEVVDGGPHRADPRGLRARLGRVCAVAVSEVGVSGAGVTVMGGVEEGLAGQRDQLWATGELARRLEDLQLTAGEGPCLDAYAACAPVLVGDLTAEPTRWLGFGPDAIAAGVCAVFSLPLEVGALRLGTLDLHRTSPGALTPARFADALVLAALATEILLDLAGDADLDAGPGGGRDPTAPEASGLLAETAGWLPDVHAEVHQATGMVCAREHISVGEALLRIRAHAFAHGQLIDHVARRIISRDLVLTDHDDGEYGDGPAGPEAERER